MTTPLICTQTGHRLEITLLTIRKKSGNQDVWILPVSGGDHIQITTHPQRDESLSWNHDGTEIVFDSNRSGGNWDIWTKPVSGGDAVRLTTHLQFDMEPSISPNGNKIAFISLRSGNCDIWLMDYDGSNQTQLTNNSYFEGGICWSPDGTYLAYLANNAGNFDIWIMSVLGGEPIQFTTHFASDMHPSWSPDGSLIAFTSDRNGNNDIWTKEVNCVNIHEHKKKVNELMVYPNPFYQSTKIEYEILQETKVVLKIYDLSGKEIKTLVDEYQLSGEKNVIWDGTDSSGKYLHSGFYNLHINVNGKLFSKKLILNR